MTSLNRTALIELLAYIQNSTTFTHQDIMSFAGMCNTAELADHVQACFSQLRTDAEKSRALMKLQAMRVLEAA